MTSDVQILVIDDVNFDLLEKQRVHLIDVLAKIEPMKEEFTFEEVDSVRGISNMLDEWSDMEWEKRSDDGTVKRVVRRRAA